MRTLTVARILALVCTGLTAGIFLGHRMGVSLAMPALSASGFVQLEQIIHGVFVRMIPPLMIGGVVASIAWAALLRRRQPDAEFWLVAAAAAAIVIAIAITRAVNVPINDQLMTWRVDAPPTNLLELWRPWGTAHSLRTVLAVLAFVLQAVAVSVSASRPATVR